MVERRMRVEVLLRIWLRGNFIPNKKSARTRIFHYHYTILYA
jgi:hypothetical protein